MARDTTPDGLAAETGDRAHVADVGGGASPQAEEPIRSRAKGWRGWLGPAVVVLTLLIALSGVVPWGSASGEIRSTGAPHGDFTVPVAECYNDGEAWSSDVWIITRLERTWGGKTGFRGGLELVEDGAGGWRAILENPNSCDGFDCPKRAVEPRHCPVCDVRSEARGWWWRRRGHARIDCSFPPGGTLKVERAFPGCAIVMPMGGDPWPHALVDPGERYSRDGDGRRRAQRPPVVRSRIQSRRSPRSASRRSPGARPTFSRRSPRGSVR